MLIDIRQCPLMSGSGIERVVRLAGLQNAPDYDALVIGDN
jgi:hypothetical protein